MITAVFPSELGFFFWDKADQSEEFFVFFPKSACFFLHNRYNWLIPVRKGDEFMLLITLNQGGNEHG